MTDYASLPTTQIDADSPLIEDTLIKLRDNPIAITEGAPGAPKNQTASLQDACVTNAKMASGAIRQANLSTSTGSVSTTSAGNFTLPGGSYGFYPQVRVSNDLHEFDASIALAEDNEGFAAKIYLSEDGGGLAYAQQRYINSSPPYNLGDGDVPIFIFAKVNAAGDVISTYTADVPPWAYNGPTRVTADFVEYVSNGKGELIKAVKLQKKLSIDPDTGDIVEQLIEVTDSIKNADMPLIPHPFSLKAGESVVLLDPPETEALLKLHETEESIADLLMEKYLTIENTGIARQSPPGVMPVAIKWKDTKKKWMASPKLTAKFKKS